MTEFDSVASKLNILPPVVKRKLPFIVWFEKYKLEICMIYQLFKNELHDVKPFCAKNLDDLKILRKFAIFLYKGSSGI